MAIPGTYGEMYLVQNWCFSFLLLLPPPQALKDGSGGEDRRARGRVSMSPAEEACLCNLCQGAEGTS